MLEIKLLPGYAGAQHMSSAACLFFLLSLVLRTVRVGKQACLFVCRSGEHLALEYAPDAPTAGPSQNPYAFTLVS